MINNKELGVTRRHPLIFGLIICFIFMVSIIIPGIICQILIVICKFGYNEWVLQGISECFGAICGILIVFIFGYKSIWSERGKSFGSGLITSGYFIFISLSSLATNLRMLLEGNDQIAPIWQILAFTVTVFLIGLTEETYFRGIVSNLFYDKHANDAPGVWCAVIGSGFVFGFMHLSNLASADLVGVLVQVANASVMGMLLTAIYYRCRNIWVVVFVHGLIDFCAAFYAGFTRGGSLAGTISTYSPYMFVSIIPYLIAVLVLLRSSKMKEIVEYKRSRDVSLGLIEDNLDTSEEQAQEYAKAYKRSRLSGIIAVATASLMMIGMIVASIYFYNGKASSEFFDNGGVFSITRTLKWENEAGKPSVFDDDLGSFGVQDTKDYEVTIISYPGDSDANAVFTIYENGKEVFSETYGGRCSTAFDMKLSAGKSYQIIVHCDYSKVDEPMSHVITVKVVSSEKE